jgi:hypothetical protein
MQAQASTPVTIRIFVAFSFIRSSECIVLGFDGTRLRDAAVKGKDVRADRCGVLG